MARSTIRFALEPWAAVYIVLMARMGGGERMTNAVRLFVCQRGLVRLG